MIDKQCKNCKYWDNDIDVKSIGLGKCGYAIELWEAIERDFKKGLKIKPELSQVKAFVNDGEEYRAMLLTKDDFYCAGFLNHE